jgi:hypothetical protein
MYDFVSNNKYTKEAQQLVKKHNMTEWDDFVRGNEADIEELRRAAEGR